MNNTRNIPDKASSCWSVLWQRLLPYVPDKGFFTLAAVILFLTALACLDVSSGVPMVVSGEISPVDITADRSFLVEDAQATRTRREQARQMQPLVCDLVLLPVEQLHTQVRDILVAVNRAETPAEKEAARQRISQEIGEEAPITMVTSLANAEVQELLTTRLLPYVQQTLSLGVLPEMRVALPYRGGIMIRNPSTDEETLRADAQTVPDIKSLEVQLSQKIKELPVAAPSRRSLGQLLAELIRPTLTPNYEITAARAAEVDQAVKPVRYRVEKGENIVRQGERVSGEQQLKIQALWKRKATSLNVTFFAGIAVCGLLLSSGLLFSPSGKPASQMSTRDYIFIASLLVVFSLIAKGLTILGAQLAASSVTLPPDSLAFAVPIAGAASLASLIFSTRRYLVTGLLLAFFCTIISRGGLGLFLFYFLGAMWSTRLTSRTQTRQDAVRSMLPMVVGLYAMWAGATFLQGGLHTRYFFEALAVAGGAVFSMIIIFAMAPVVELAFGYTTRFRLMELLNLEQPVLRELMLNAPGTYHHSLIVSNMVEAGAKAIGAHSLLCKVAALYHDIGKISKAGYFIENQLTDENPHDKLTPSMSALILISHSKQGAELAQQHRLGKEVIDIIRQHHGTSLIRYFYQKAERQTDAPPPKVEDFSYPGPKPQSREAAIVMLADAVEASSRTLSEPTPNRLMQHIQTIIRGIHTDGQLDESELTFRDLDALALSFHRILLGIFHHRIPYPDKKKRDAPVA